VSSFSTRAPQRGLSRPSQTVGDSLASRAAVAELSALAGSPAHPADEMTILRDGKDAFPAMHALIEAAREQILFENFIFAGDGTGRHFADALAAAARRGVDVRVLYDPVGTMMVRGGSIARTLRSHGVTARAFQPLSPYTPRSWLQLRHRDHRKTLTVDDHTSIVGGLCISDNWAPQWEGGRGWRDTALLARGAVAGDVARFFDAMWEHADHDDVAAPQLPPRALPPPVVLVAADRPGERRVARLYTWLANRAQRSIEITDAYLVLPTQSRSALEAAARRGVAVRMLLPGRNNHPVAGAAARHGYDSLLNAGVEIWEWRGAMVHAKTAVVDQEVALVGSSNLDPLSMQRNYELNLLAADPALGASMHEMFERDLEGAVQIDGESWRRRPRWRRCAEAAGALFAPDL